MAPAPRAGRTCAGGSGAISAAPGEGGAPFECRRTRTRPRTRTRMASCRGTCYSTRRRCGRGGGGQRPRPGLGDQAGEWILQLLFDLSLAVLGMANTRTRGLLLRSVAVVAAAVQPCSSGIRGPSGPDQPARPARTLPQQEPAMSARSPSLLLGNNRRSHEKARAFRRALGTCPWITRFALLCHVSLHRGKVGHRFRS